MKSIEFVSRNYGFDVAIKDNKKQKTEVIGVAVRLDSLVNGLIPEPRCLYIHLSTKHVPTYIGNDGREFKVPIREAIVVYPKDELHFDWRRKGFYVDV